MGIKHSEHLKRRWAKIPDHEKSDIMARIARSKWSNMSEKERKVHMKKMWSGKKKIKVV